MKIKYKRRNSPRLQNAIKRAIRIAHNMGGWWYVRAEDIGRMIFCIAYKADKYDVLNKLADGCRRLAKAFIRADIRWKRPTRLRTIGILIIIFILIITFQTFKIMTNKEYEIYAKAAAAKGEPVYPRDRGIAPKYFGQQYAGSSLKRKNDIRRKRMARA